MNEVRIKEILEHCGVLLRSTHVVLASGLHSDAYVQKKLLMDGQYEAEFSELCKLLARSFPRSFAFDAVVGPEIGAVRIAEQVAHHLSLAYGRTVHALRAEKDGKSGFRFTQGQDLIVCDRSILVVEDVVSTGASASRVAGLVRSHGGYVKAIGAFVDRSGGTAEPQFGDVVMFHALLRLHLDAWSEDRCPLCAQGIPVNGSVGRGAEFLARKYGLVQ